MKLVFARKARQDLDTIADHIAADDVDAAMRLVFEIESRARILLASPSI